MNKAPWILAGIFTALFLSWYGMVWGPASQQNGLLAHVSGEIVYPRDRDGLAKQGAEIYRANGCYHCHSQQVNQGEVKYELLLAGTGSNVDGLLATLERQEVKPEGNELAKIELSLFLNSGAEAGEAEKNNLKKLKNDDRKAVFSLASLTDKAAVDRARDFLELETPKEGQKEEKKKVTVKLSKELLTWEDAKVKVIALKSAGAAVMLKPHQPENASDPAAWADLNRGWGDRRSVARDYLYDSPVMLGSQRIGPDLADIGGRSTDADWHYRHLYNPRAITGREKSVMPPYKFLFNKRKLVMGEKLGEGAITVTVTDDVGKTAVESIERGYEVTPKPAARALVVYLLSLRQPAVVPEAPKPKPMAASKPSENSK